MTLSTASLHILLTQPPPQDTHHTLRLAYRALGFGPAPAGTIAAREAVLARGDNFLSVYDSACAASDDGSLRRLATTISDQLRTCVLVTTVQDSEDFEFILFHLGRQVDSAVGDPDGHPGGLAAVRRQEQAAVWQAALGRMHFGALPHRSGDEAGDPVARFIAIAGAASRASHPHAEDRLAAWCRMAHLPVRAALRQFADAAASPSSTRIALAPAATQRRHGRVPAPGLTAHRADADYPYHRFFPAAWPAEAGTDAAYVWPVLCRGRGLHRLRLVLHVDRAGDFMPFHVQVTAYRSRHGQIAAAAPLASFGQTIPRDIAALEADLAVHADPFGLPDTDDGNGEYMILLRVDLHVPAHGEVLITPTLRADAEGSPLILATLRLAALRPLWRPIVADPLDAAPGRRQAVLRLNAPAALTHVAFLPDTGQELRDSLRALLETWLLPMTETKLTASIRTQRHPAEGGGGTVARYTVPLADLVQGQIWPKLFQAGRDLQSLQVEVGNPGALAGIAGLSVHTSLRDDQEPAGEAAILILALWVIADENALALLRLDIHRARDAFADWVRGAAPLQAWMSDCAWIPAFDRYESYAMTLYEAAAAVDWVAKGLAGTLCDRAWLRRRLRFVAPHMWLGWELASLLDTLPLAAIAEITGHADCVEVRLRRPADLPRLERMLAPLLPLSA